METVNSNHSLNVQIKVFKNRGARGKSARRDLPVRLGPSPADNSGQRFPREGANRAATGQTARGAPAVRGAHRRSLGSRGQGRGAASRCTALSPLKSGGGWRPFCVAGREARRCCTPPLTWPCSEVSIAPRDCFSWPLGGLAVPGQASRPVSAEHWWGSHRQ